MNAKTNFRLRMNKVLQRYAKTFSAEHYCTERMRKELASNNFPFSEFGTAAHITASAMVVHRASGSLLLVHHRELRRWIQPGGHLKATELPEEAAKREATEETGLRALRIASWHRRNHIPIDIDVHSLPPRHPLSGQPHKHYDFRYVFYSMTQKSCIGQPSEIDGVRWIPLSLGEGRVSITNIRRALKKMRLFRLI